MSRLQTSFILSQRRYYPGIRGTINDCAVVSAITAVHASSPWLRLPSITAFRREAGAPDSEGGLQTDEVARGIRGCFPSLRGHLDVLRGERWASLMRLGEAGHPLTVAIDSSKLHRDLAFGFDGFHQVTLAVTRPGSGRVMYANPLANPYARWLEVSWDLLRDAVMAYGKAHAGERGAWAVALPTAAEALVIYAGQTVDDTPFDQEDIDAATAELQARIDAAMEALSSDAVPT